MENKKKIIIAIIVIAVIAVIAYLLISKKKEQEQSDKVASLISSASQALANSAVANSQTAQTVSDIDSTVPKKKWITSTFEPNIGENIFVEAGQSVKLLKNNSSSSNIKKTITADKDYPNGRLVGSIHKKTTGNYWNVVPASNTGVNTRQWIRKGDYRNKQILYVLR